MSSSSTYPNRVLICIVVLGPKDKTVIKMLPESHLCWECMNYDVLAGTYPIDAVTPPAGIFAR